MLYYVSATVNPILYNVMSHRYRRAFCDTLFRCSARRRHLSDRASVNVAALTSSFTLSAATASLSHDRLHSRLCISPSVATSSCAIVTNSDETAVHRRTVDIESLAVGGRPAETTETAGDSRTVLRSEEVADTDTSETIVDMVDVRAVVESRRQCLPVLGHAAAASITDCTV